jgi:citrate lyase beta subunit
MHGRARPEDSTAEGVPRATALAEAWQRLGVGIAQTALAIAASVALLGREELAVVRALAVAATAATGYGVWRWGGIWSRR